MTNPRHLTVIRRAGKWRVVGTGRWADYGDPWLCAHDVFHHDLAEVDAVCAELKSFGTQLWLEYQSEGLENITPDAIAGSLLAGCTSQLHFKRLVVPLPTEGVNPPEPPIGTLLVTVLDEAVALLRTRLPDVYAFRLGRQPRPTTLQAVYSSANIQAMHAWILAGWAYGMAQYPDAYETYHVFKQFQRFLDRIPEGIQRFSFTLNTTGQDITLKASALQRLWELTNSQESAKE